MEGGLSVRTVHEGKPDEHLEAFLQRNILPQDYATITEMDSMLGITSKDPQVLTAVLLALSGAALLLFLDRFSPDKR